MQANLNEASLHVTAIYNCDDMEDISVIALQFRSAAEQQAWKPAVQRVHSISWFTRDDSAEHLP